MISFNTLKHLYVCFKHSIIELSSSCRQVIWLQFTISERIFDRIRPTMAVTATLIYGPTPGMRTVRIRASRAKNYNVKHMQSVDYPSNNID